MLFQLYKVYRGESILIELNVAHRTLYHSVFVSQSGVQGLTMSKIETLAAGQTINPLQKISLLAANFAKMQERAAAFGFTAHWSEMGAEEFGRITKYMFDKTNKGMVIDLEALPILSPFTFDDLQAAFLVLFVMLGVSIVTFTFEIYIFKRNGKRLTKK